MPLHLRIDRLRVVAFRNIADVVLELAPRVNVISGDNGQGKTSLLEGLYFLATSRSFRAEKLAEIAKDDASGSTLVEGKLCEDGVVRRQRAVIENARRTVYVDEQKVSRLSSYAVQTPVVVFHPGDLELVSGSATKRRKLLDRIALFIDPISGDHRARYTRAQRERQRALELGSSREAEIFESLMAEHGASLTRARQQAADSLREALQPAFASMAPSSVTLELRYAPASSIDVDVCRRELRSRRERDRRSRSTSFGPGKDDVLLLLEGRPARRHASQGQQRILTLALKAAELDCIRAARGTQPILLLDDVSSELDPTRTGAVYDFVRRSESQVVVTTTRPDLFKTPGLSDSERADFRVCKGALTPSASSAATGGALAEG